MPTRTRRGSASGSSATAWCWRVASSRERHERKRTLAEPAGRWWPLRDLADPRDRAARRASAGAALPVSDHRLLLLAARAGTAGVGAIPAAGVWPAGHTVAGAETHPRIRRHDTRPGVSAGARRAAVRVGDAGARAAGRTHRAGPRRAAVRFAPGQLRGLARHRRAAAADAVESGAGQA